MRVLDPTPRGLHEDAGRDSLRFGLPSSMRVQAGSCGGRQGRRAPGDVRGWGTRGKGARVRQGEGATRVHEKEEAEVGKVKGGTRLARRRSTS